MPRSMAPPPSGEMSVVVTKPFSVFPPILYAPPPPLPLPQRSDFAADAEGADAGGGVVPQEKIEIIGEPNRVANVKWTSHVGKEGQTVLVKEGNTLA